MSAIIRYIIAAHLGKQDGISTICLQIIGIRFRSVCQGQVGIGDGLLMDQVCILSRRVKVLAHQCDVYRKVGMSRIIGGRNCQLGTGFCKELSVHVINVILGVETKFGSAKGCIGILISFIDADTQFPLVLLCLFPSVSFRSALVVPRLIIHGDDAADCLAIHYMEGDGLGSLISGRCGRFR